MPQFDNQMQAHNYILLIVFGVSINSPLNRYPKCIERKYIILHVINCSGYM